MKQVLSFFIIFFAFFIVTGACSREKSFETKEGKVTVKEGSKEVKVTGKDGSDLTIKGDEKEGKVKIKTEEGETIEIAYNKDKLPDDFPKDVPVYFPSKVTMSQTMDKGKNVMASLATKDEQSKVAEFYKKALPMKGWEIKGKMEIGSMALFQGQKGEKLLNVTINREDNKTVISLVVGKE